MTTIGIRCIRLSLVSLTFLFFVLSILLIYFAAKSLHYPERSEDFINLPKSSSNFLIASGVALLAVSFIGFWGAFKENRCMLITFGTVLCITFLIEFSCGLILVEYRSQVENSFIESFNKEIERYEKNDTKSIAIIDKIQSDHKCCGSQGYTDYKILPLSCCAKLPNSTKVNDSDELYICPKEDIYPIGCATLYSEALYSLLGFGIFPISVATIQLFGIVASFTLARRLNEYETV